MKRYFAKPDTWFKEGTEAFYEEEMFPVGTLFDEDGISHGSAIYRGTYVVGTSEDGLKEEDPDLYEKWNGHSYDNYWYDKGFKKGDLVRTKNRHSNFSHLTGLVLDIRDNRRAHHLFSEHLILSNIIKTRTRKIFKAPKSSMSATQVLTRFQS